MHNDLFSIGPLTIHTYGVMVAVGLVAAFLSAAQRAKERSLNVDSLYSMGLLMALFGFLGAKLLYCIVEFPRLLQDPLSVLSGGGFVVYGGIIAGLIAALLYCRAKALPFLPYADIAAPSIALAQGFGRLGCLFAGCCYGAPASGWLSITFQHSDIAPNGIPLVPTQILSSLGDFLIAFFLFWYAKNPRQNGSVAALYMLLYSVGRFAIEFFRADFRGSIGPLSTSQFIAIILCAAAVCALVLLRRAKRAPGPDA